LEPIAGRGLAVWRRLCAGAAVACAVSACGWLANNPAAPGTTAQAVAPSPQIIIPAAVEPPATLVGAGDIGLCNGPSEATAHLLDGIAGTIFTVGDNAYPNGTAENFARCYDATWGRHRARTNPAPGNHEYETNGAAAYFAYFGASAGPAGLGYYSYDVGAWHVLSLNSNVPAGPASAQYEWVRNDLASRSRACTMAYWHHPVFSSGPNGNVNTMRDLWRLLDQAEVDVVVSAHDHVYERFAPQDADGRFDPRGMREFVAGTGGGALYQQRTVQPNSEVRDNHTWGVLKFTLRSSGYDWEFVPIDVQSFRDAGSAECVR